MKNIFTVWRIKY